MNRQYLNLTIGSVIISTYAIGIALADKLGATDITFLRMLWGLVGVMVIAGAKVLRSKVKMRDLAIIIALGIVGQGFATLFGSESIKNTTHVPSAVLIVNTAPFIAYLAQVVLRRDKLSWRNLGTIAVGIIGLAIIMLDPNESINISNNLLGYGYAFLNALCIVIFGLFIGKYSKKYSSFTVLAISLLSSIVLLGGFKFNEISIPQLFSGYGILFGIFFGCFTLLIPQLIRITALEKIKTSTVLMFSLVIPISNTLLSYFLLDSEITIRFFIGSIITLFSLFMVIRRD